jgi:hypothetical protein
VEVATVDIGQRSQLAALFVRVDRFDHLVVTAADLPYGPVMELTESDLMRAVRSKFLGPVFAAQESAARINSGGSITFTSGIAAHRPMRGGSAAAAINSGLEGLVRALAIELAPLRVNAVSPGWTDTPIWDGMAGMTKERKNDRTPEHHEFHMHQIHFLLLEVNAVPVTPDQRQFFDMYQVPFWSGTGPYSNRLRLRRLCEHDIASFPATDITRHSAALVAFKNLPDSWTSRSKKDVPQLCLEHHG